MLPHWPQLLLFVGVILLLALYGLTASGHFPSEFRGENLKGPAGAVTLWGSMVLAVLAAGAALASGWQHLTWYAAVIGGGAVLLFAPLLLRPFPDTFVNGPLGLVIFSMGAAAVAGVLWMAF
jgi:hypothetical protein